MQARYVTVDHRRVHLRTGGHGAPLVMLHPSPLSSSMLTPLASEFSRHFRVLALDTPGYGLSDPLTPPPRSLDDYLEPLARTLDTLGIARCCVYGAATGAQIALEFAKRYPERVALLVMDSAGHIDAQTCERLAASYFPDVTPRLDGGHLLTWWRMVRDLNLFFPWSEPRAANRIARDLPEPAALQAVLLEYLRAGTGYDAAYRPALFNERIDRLAGLDIPTILTRWRSSIVLRITDALIAAGLPACVEVLELAEGFEARATGLLRAIADRYQGPSVKLPAEELPSVRVGGAWVRAAHGTLHLRGRFDGNDRPVVLLHAAGGSTRLLESLLQRVSAPHPVVAFDLPGHGASQNPEPAPAATGELAEALIDVLEELDLGEAHLIGDEFGAQLALEIAAQAPDCARTIVGVGLPVIDSDERARLVTHYVPDLTPRWDGSHLVTAWQMLRDRELFWPWYERTAAAAIAADPELDPFTLQDRLVALLECGTHFPAVARSMILHDTATTVRRQRCPVVLAARPSDPFRGRLVKLHESIPQTRWLPLPPDPRTWWSSIGEMLAALEIIRRGKR